MLTYNELLEILSNPEKYKRIYIDIDLYQMIRNDLFSHLSIVLGFAEFLGADAQSAVVREWGQKCHATVKQWVNEYNEIQVSCEQSAGDRVLPCIAKTAHTATAESQTLLADKDYILSELVGDSLADAGEDLFRKLEDAAQIYQDLRSDDWTWLLEYIEWENDIRSGKFLNRE